MQKPDSYMEEKNGIAYNPSAIVNLFKNALNSEATRKIIAAKGIYVPGKGQNYNGYYYDQLKDEGSDACITLIVPSIIRASLAAQQTIECYAYLAKKVQINGARIELQLNLTELLAQKESQFTTEQIEAFKLLQRKAEIGYKDVDSFLKTKIIRNEPFRIVILIGKTGIIDSDIKHQLEEAISFYDFEFVRINLGSEWEIMEALKNYHTATDLLAISRGGSDRLEIFNKPVIAEAALSVSCHFITAIGHRQDNTLLQKLADKAFITPTALGQYFNDMYNGTIAELQNSKAKLVDDITKQLQTNYAQQIKNLEERIKATEKLHSKSSQGTEALYKQEIEILKNQLAATVQQYQERLKSQKPNVVVYWILIIAAAIIGVLLGRLIG